MLLSLALRAAAAPLPLDTAGCDQIGSLEEVSFTFNVEKGGELKASRAWTWRPASDEVVRTVDGEALGFARGAPVGEQQESADAQFVNDWFWLMPQCHAIWSTDAHITDSGESPLPMGEGTGRKLVVTYSQEGGGYTPGDAYDLFLDLDGRIAAWHFRQGGQPSPSMTTSFTDYAALGPVSVATEHRSPDGDFRLYFTDLAAR
jgi:hypothetical protein